MKKLIALMLAYIMVFGTYVSLGVSAYAASYKVGSVSLSKTTYVYNGKAKKPKVVVKDSRKQTIPAKGNYTVKYPKNACVGSKNVTITFKGKYKHNKTVKKKIKVIPQITTIKDIKPKVGGFFVKWKKVAKEVTGYQVQYSTNKSFPQKGSKTLTVKGNNTFTKEVKGLSEGKKYFVRVRAYKTAKGKNYFSYWKTVKNITTKAKDSNTGGNASSVTYEVLVPNKLRLGSDGMYQIKDEHNKWIGVDKYYAVKGGCQDINVVEHDWLMKFRDGPYWTEWDDVKNKRVKPFVTNAGPVIKYYTNLYKAYLTIGINDKMSDYEKYLRISKWIYENVSYAYDKNGKPNHQRAYAEDIFKYHETICGGYASINLDFCYLADIDCVYLYDDTHAWNGVKLNGYWYYNDSLYNCYESTIANDSTSYSRFLYLLDNSEWYHYTEDQKKEEIETEKLCIYNNNFNADKMRTDKSGNWAKCSPKGTFNTFNASFDLFVDAINNIEKEVGS